MLNEHRIQIIIDEKLKFRLNKLPWGLTSPLVRLFLSFVADEFERDGGAEIMSVLHKHNSINGVITDPMDWMLINIANLENKTEKTAKELTIEDLLAFMRNMYGSQNIKNPDSQTFYRTSDRHGRK